MGCAMGTFPFEHPKAPYANARFAKFRKKMLQMLRNCKGNLKQQRKKRCKDLP